jgi:hypothetical protein
MWDNVFHKKIVAREQVKMPEKKTNNVSVLHKHEGT